VAGSCLFSWARFARLARYAGAQRVPSFTGSGRLAVREVAMPRVRFVLLIGLLAAFSSSGSAQGQVPELAFDSNADFLRTPASIYMGEVGGVGRNSQGHIFVYTRTGHPYATLGDNRTFYRGGSRLFEFDATGKYVRELGQDVYGFNTAFGLKVDAQDNVWVVDGSANQVIKFDPQGRIRLVLGRKPEAMAVRPAAPAGGGGEEGGGAARGGGPPGAGTPGATFNQPTDVAFDKAGNVYVADGVGNTNRIVKFAQDGRFIKQWGSTGKAPGQFNGVKALAIDAQGNVYAADVGNKRIQVFDAEGTFKSEFGNVGTPAALCVTSGATQYLYVSHVGDQSGMDDATIYKVGLDGEVVGRFGAAGKLPKEFGVANSIDCRNENELLVGEMSNWRVQKVTFKR
jgi:DNA-binding beta-propeller fold protein YncE